MNIIIFVPVGFMFELGFDLTKESVFDYLKCFSTLLVT